MLGLSKPSVPVTENGPWYWSVPVKGSCVTWWATVGVPDRGFMPTAMVSSLPGSWVGFGTVQWTRGAAGFQGGDGDAVGPG